MPPPLILASTSPYRRALMERLGLPFACRSPRLDEEAAKRALGETSAVELAAALARAKAESLAEVEPEAVILGGDQVVAVEGRVLGKPGSVEAAVDQLRALSGRDHELVTAVAVLQPGGRRRSHVDVAVLSMRPLTSEELRRYVEADRPIDCAGAYKLESRGIALFERIECADQTAITGLPLMWLAGVLRELGYAVP